METIKHSIATGWGRGALHAALAYDANDKFGGVAIKQMRFNPDTGATAIVIGVSSTEIALTVAAQRAISIHTTSALAAGAIKSVEIAQIHTGASTAHNIEVMKVQLTSDVKTGAWVNAIFGRVNYTANGWAYGSASAICGEVSLAPGGSHSGQGTYAVFQAELDVPASAIGIGSECSFFRASVWGDQKGLFDDNGFFFVLTGLTDLTGHLWFDNTLRINIGGATWYLPMSSAQASYTTAYPIVSTSTTGISFNPTLVPDSTRTNYIWSYGTRATAKDLAMAASSDYNLDPIQINLNITGTAPTSSTVNLSYMKINHASAHMTALRLKCSDWNVTIAKNIKDAYVYQGEIDITASCAIASEVCGLGLTMNLSAGTITGAVRGIVIAMYGSSMPAATSMGLFINTGSGATLGNGIYIETQGGTTINNGLHIANAGTLTSAIKLGGTITNFLNLTGAGNSGFVTTGGTGTTHTLKIIVPGGGTGYVRIFQNK